MLPEDLRLQRRHGIVEFETTMHHLRRFLKSDYFLLDIGAGTGRYTSALMAEGYRVKAVELVRRNIEVFLKREPTADVVQGDARDMPFVPSATADVTLLLGPLYHLIGDEEKLKALNEAKRVTKPGGLIFVAYLMNEYSILSYCFDEDRIEGAELSKVYMVGNVLIDNIRFLNEKIVRPAIMDELHLEEGKYLVLTLNRKMLLADKEKINVLLAVIDAEARKAGIQVVAPLRGKALEAVLAFQTHQGIADHHTGITLVAPQAYLDFCYLTSHTQGIITDSGNVAEEATFNGIVLYDVIGKAFL